MLKVEMVRILIFLDLKGENWVQRASLRSGLSSDIEAGLLAYAHKQHFLCRELAKKFASHWVGLFKEYAEALPQRWPSAYQNVPAVVRKIKARRHRTLAHQRAKAIDQDIDVEMGDE